MAYRHKTQHISSPKVLYNIGKEFYNPDVSSALYDAFPLLRVSCLLSFQASNKTVIKLPEGDRCSGPIKLQQTVFWAHPKLKRSEIGRKGRGKRIFFFFSPTTTLTFLIFKTWFVSCWGESLRSMLNCGIFNGLLWGISFLILRTFQ